MSHEPAFDMPAAEQLHLFDPGPFTEQTCRRLFVHFRGGEERIFPIHFDGDWTYDHHPPRLIVRPHGRGVPRHEIPLGNVLSIMVAPA